MNNTCKQTCFLEKRYTHECVIRVIFILSTMANTLSHYYNSHHNYIYSHHKKQILFFSKNVYERLFERIRNYERLFIYRINNFMKIIKKQCDNGNSSL